MEQVVHSAKGSSDGGEDGNKRLPGVLLANKSDLKERRVISPKLGSDLAQHLGLM